MIHYRIMSIGNKIEYDLINILENISIICNLDIQVLKSKKRNKHIIDAKRLYCFFCRDLTNLTLQKIGKEINIDHTTVLYHLRTCKNYLETDKNFKKLYDEIKIKLILHRI